MRRQLGSDRIFWVGKASGRVASRGGAGKQVPPVCPHGARDCQTTVYLGYATVTLGVTDRAREPCGATRYSVRLGARAIEDFVHGVSGFHSSLRGETGRATVADIDRITSTQRRRPRGSAHAPLPRRKPRRARVPLGGAIPLASLESLSRTARR